MKKIILAALAMGILATAGTGCGYAGVGAAGDKAVVARNDGFLFGILRKVYVCKISDAGLSACNDSEAP
jgi:hypothetical protein